MRLIIRVARSSKINLRRAVRQLAILRWISVSLLLSIVVAPAIAQNQKFKFISPNLLSETLFEGRNNAVAISIKNFIIGPQLHAQNIKLDGACILEVRSGEGVLVTKNQKNELRVGSTLQLVEQQEFSIRNTSNLPLAIRVVFLQAR